MGIVYKAQDTKLDRTVAIKVLPSAALGSEDDRARFYREAKAPGKQSIGTGSRRVYSSKSFFKRTRPEPFEIACDRRGDQIHYFTGIILLVKMPSFVSSRAMNKPLGSPVALNVTLWKPAEKTSSAKRVTSRPRTS